MSAERILRLEVGEMKIKVPERVVLRKLIEDMGGAPVRPRPSLDQPALGEYWPGQGGIYVGEMKPRDGKPGYCVIAPIDDRVRGKSLAYGGQGEDEPGAKCRFDGLANTLALRESKHSHPAAEWTAGLEVEGHRDLYLPSMTESWLCFINAGEHFEKVWHLTSTQYSPNNAWTLGFEHGYTYCGAKDDEFAVRPVRSIKVINSSI